MANRKCEDEPRPSSYWGPVNMMQEMERAFDSVRTKIGDLAYSAGSMISPRVPAVDVREEGDWYVVDAELPGLKREDVSIELGEGTLYIKAHKEERAEESGEGYLRKERGSMSFYRRLALPADADRDHVSAKLEDGILRITIPRLQMPAEPHRRVSVD